MRAAMLVLTAVFALEAWAEDPSCALAQDQQAWTQRALDAWERGSRDLLRTSATPLPWIVLVGPHCAWHLAPPPDTASFPKEALALSGGAQVVPGWLFAGEAVPVVAVPHDGTVRLPSGARVAADPMAMANLRRDGKEAFFVMSTLEVWRHGYPQMPESDLQPFFLGVFSHEIVHTRQLVALAKAFERVVERHGIPPVLDDDVVERKLRKKKRYVRAYQAERDLLFRAAAEPELARVRELAGEALRMAEQRRARWLQGRRAWLGELEPMFLSMEGLGEWCRYRLLTDDPSEPRSDAELLALVRGRDNHWSQDEGLALFLVLDRLAPGWQAGVLEGVPRSPFLLLGEAIQGRMPA